MLTKAYLLQQVEQKIDDYPDAALLYRVGDPRLMVLLDAMATQLSLFSQQIDVAMAEPFGKSRDSTVLAAAAMRGIIRKATPGRVRLMAKNSNLAAVMLEAGRVILDTDSNSYVVTGPATLPAGTEVGGVVTPGVGFVMADQYLRHSQSHIAERTEDFYAIALPDPEDGSSLHTIEVTDGGGAPYGYRKNFINALPNEKIYTVESDDRGVVYVRFGVDGIAGTRVAAGDVFNIHTTWSIGRLNLKPGSPFSLDSLETEQLGVDLSKIDIILHEVRYSGDSPMSMATMRRLCRYPAIYDDSAVMLGEFDFLVRKKYPDMPFLSVWNESMEESARGADLDNINTLFVACFDSTEATLHQSDPLVPVPPVVVSAPTSRQSGIRNLILAADNSYKVKLYTPVTSEIYITVTARVSTAHRVFEVEAKIKQAILSEFGRDAGNHARKPMQRLIYALLKEKVPETHEGGASLNVVVDGLPGPFRPELWRYATEDSVAVTVKRTNVFVAGWE